MAKVPIGLAAFNSFPWLMATLLSSIAHKSNHFATARTSGFSPRLEK
jgi:hypothetical protein